MILGLNETYGQFDRNDAEGFFNKMMGIGARIAAQKDRVLCEDHRLGTQTRMGDLLEGLPENSRIRSHTAIMLENHRQWMDGLSEATKLVHIGDFEKYAFPMVRAIFPNLASHNLASVQPMLGPISMVFFMKFIYGMTKGSAKAGTDVIENPNEFYASEDIDEEQLDVGDGSTTTFTGTLAFQPVKPGTFVLTWDSFEAHDDGNGVLVGDVGSGTNTINYVTGAVAVELGTAATNGEPLLCAYTFDGEGNDTVPDLDMQITSAPIVARTRKLRTRWSLEAAQDLRNLHGLEAEVEQVAAVSNELKFEIDREMINAMLAIASNSVSTFSKTPDSGISFTEHKLKFHDVLLEASNTIFSKTQRATGTWIVCGVNVASLIESMPGFVSSPRPKGTRAVYKCGVLNGTWEVWKDPGFSTNDYLMGYQGDSMWEVGFIFAPYILGYTTATIALDDFIGRKGMMSRYGRRAVDGRFYCTGSISA
jgi:Major capsid protein Gp23